MDPHFISNSSRGQHASASSLCFPYFSLDKFGANKTGAGGSFLHPIRPLMQSYTASAKKEQDTQQAVSSFSETPKDHCFHVAQLWAILVDEGEISSRIALSSFPLDPLN